MISVGQWVVDETLSSAKEWAIHRFGSGDKNVMITGTVIILLIFATVIDVFSTRRRWVSVAGIGAFALIGVATAVTPVGRMARGATVGAALLIGLGVAACGDSSTTNAATSTPAATTKTADTMATATGLGGTNYGEGCAAVPKDGGGRAYRCLRTDCRVCSDFRQFPVTSREDGRLHRV